MREGAALVNRIVRYVILALSLGVMAIGLTVMTGLVMLRSIPSDYRLVAGAVIFLYGLYRFVVAIVRAPRR